MAPPDTDPMPAKTLVSSQPGTMAAVWLEWKALQRPSTRLLPPESRCSRSERWALGQELRFDPSCTPCKLSEKDRTLQIVMHGTTGRKS